MWCIIQKHSVQLITIHSYKNVKDAKEVWKKDSEEKVLDNNSGIIVTEPELFTTNIAMINPAVKSSEPKTQDTTNLQQAIQSQEVLELSSDSESEISELKESVDSL